MLKIVAVDHQHLLKPLLDRFDPSQATWIVSDLKTKLAIKQNLFSRRLPFAEDAVLRASDLWRLLLKQYEFDKKLVSDAFAKALLKQILDKNAKEIGVNSSAHKTIFAYMKLLSPIFFHHQGVESLEAWFTEKPESAVKWREWYLRARFCMNILFHRENILIKDWVAPFLLAEYGDRLGWQQDIHVDLGANLTQSEAEIFRNFGRNSFVTIYEPHPSWREEFQYLLRPYDFLRAESQDVQRFFEPDQKQKKKESHCLRFTGALAEVKYATASVRRWLDDGVSPDQIGIAAPDIEKYWPCLRSFLEEEGVPFQKDVVVKMQSLVNVKNWLSQLRSRSQDPRFVDLELSYYNTDFGTSLVGPTQETREASGDLNRRTESMRYELFKSLFTHVYGIEDLEKDSEIKRMYFKQIKFGGELNREDFIATALKFWYSGDSNLAVEALGEILANAQPRTKLPWHHWLTYLESIVSQKEKLLVEGKVNGVFIASISSIHNTSLQYRIFLGLSEENFRSPKGVNVESGDILSFSSLYGFYLEHPDQSDLEFEIKWQSLTLSKEDHFLFGNTDFTGQLQSVSKFWLEELNRQGRLNEYEKISIPPSTRWDEVMRNTSVFYQVANRHDLNSLLPLLKSGIDRDLGHTQNKAFSMTERIQISPSSLEVYFKCPFLYAVSQRFKIWSLAESDLDMDPMSKGQITHALFYFLTSEPFKGERSNREIENFLQDYYEKNHSYSLPRGRKMKFSDQIWKRMKTRYLELGLRFLKHESELRQRFKNLRTVGRECRFRVYYNSELKSFSRVDDGIGVILNGVVDRIDSDQDGNLAVIDYKSSFSEKNTPSRWIKDRNLQLLLYGWILENLGIDEIRGSIGGLFYFNAKDFSRKGVRDNNRIGNLYDQAKNNRSKNSAEELNDMFCQFLDLFSEAVRGIESGLFPPTPIDRKVCLTCEFKKLCRAPHLN